MAFNSQMVSTVRAVGERDMMRMRTRSRSCARGVGGARKLNSYGGEK